MHSSFRWSVPGHFNIAQVCSRRWAASPAPASRTAVLLHQADAGDGHAYSYAQLQTAADALSHVLSSQGVKPSDRVAVVLPQRFEMAVAYMAVLQMGAVAMPLSQLFGPDALLYRLQDSGAVLAVVDQVSAATVSGMKKECPALRLVIGMDPGCGDICFDHEATSVTPPWPLFNTLATDAALLIYTSGTTGQPKGALIPHQALIGNLSGFVCSQNWFGFSTSCSGVSTHDDLPTGSHAVMWSPADWTWTGGLMDALLPTLYFGRPIVAWPGRFSADLAFNLMQQHRVTHAFLFPTALRAMMKAYPSPQLQFQLDLQAIMSAGEAAGDTVFAYCRDELGVTVNEMFGQTEINYIVGNCAMNGDTSDGIGWPAKPGSMGRAYPGHRVAVIDEDGKECAAGVPGDVAVHRLDVHGSPDPIFFLGYWNQPGAAANKFTGDWCRTGDLATRDADGYLWYQGRADDVFKAAGYRIGPSEIENCLVKHPAVANAAVVPKPDAERGNLVKAYVVLSAGFAPSDALVIELQHHVRGLLAPYEYPKEIEFIDQLPMTTTGKVQRRVLRLREEERVQVPAVVIEETL
ncbi:MAG: AMP-binding protein [Limnohabitans sp.]|nr:AMP-binding protein [Limnohabitans sp.]